MDFKYTGINKESKTQEGIIGAENLAEARKKMAAMGLSILSLKEKKPKFIINSRNFDFGWIRKLDIALFVKNFSVMIKAGLTVIEALEIAAAQSSGKLQRILKNVLSLVEQGHNLADSLAVHPGQFKKFYVEIVRVGETSGSLEENLDHLSLQIEKEVALKRKIQAALIYPIFILVTTFALGVILAVFVLPRLSKLLQSLNTELPLPTKIVLWIADLFQKQGIWIGVGVIVLICASYFISRIKFIKPIWHYCILNMPLIGRVAKIYNLARFSRNLNILLKSGLAIDESMRSLIPVFNNAVYQKKLQKVLSEIAKGKSIASSLAVYKDIFPPMVIKMINVGERSGRLEEILLYLANFYEAEVDNATKNISAIIEPLLLIVIGIIVGFVGLSIITPIYKITGSISPTK